LDGDYADVETGTATFQLESGQNITCIFTNREVPADPTPDIDVEKSAAVGSVSAGANIVYTITVTNTGDVMLNNVQLSDSVGGILSNADIVGISAPCAAGFPCNLGSLAPDAEIEIAVTLDTDPGSCGTVSNAATVTGSPSESEEQVNDTDSDNNVAVTGCGTDGEDEEEDEGDGGTPIADPDNFPTVGGNVTPSAIQPVSEVAGVQEVLPARLPATGNGPGYESGGEKAAWAKLLLILGSLTLAGLTVAKVSRVRF
jgi:uncharacterized repeat protein (TIGR01451 family)